MTLKQRQHLLAYLGYYEGAADGDWGKGSCNACREFQKDRGISADGLGGPETDEALRAAVALGWSRRAQEYSDWWEEIEFFSREEFRCKCGGKYCSGFPAEMQEQVVRIAEDARRYFGRKGYVVSGLRCSRWNALQGGVEDSQHLYGEAVDLRIEGITAEQLLAFIQTRPHRYAYKINGTNVHVDIPKRGR